MKYFFYLLKKTYLAWNRDNVSRLAAALSYYTVFSLAPLLLIAIATAGAIWGRDAVQGQILQQISGLIGADGGKAIEAMLAAAYKSERGWLASTVGIAVLFLGATGLFIQLQDALNTIWSVKQTQTSGLLKYIKDRLLSFSVVLSLGFLFLVSLIFSTALSFMTGFFSRYLPVPTALIDLINISFSIALTSCLFAAIFKILPGVHLAWKDVWSGSLLSAVLFSVGKYFLGLYLGQAALSSGYGPAGSLIVILVWSYYSAQILLFGAEFVQVQNEERGKDLQPKRNFTSTFAQ